MAAVAYRGMGNAGVKDGENLKQKARRYPYVGRVNSRI